MMYMTMWYNVYGISLIFFKFTFWLRGQWTPPIPISCIKELDTYLHA